MRFRGDFLPEVSTGSAPHPPFLRRAVSKFSLAFRQKKEEMRAPQALASPLSRPVSHEHVTLL